MGRAQIVQAEAARIPPHVDMNPILLKPTSEIGSRLYFWAKLLETALQANTTIEKNVCYQKPVQPLPVYVKNTNL